MEWIELDKLIKFQTKSKIKAGEGKSEGKYSMYTSSMIVDKYLDEFQYNEEALIMGTGGSASIHYSTGNFGTSTDCYVLYNKGKNIMLKYIYLYLLGNINILEEGFRGAGLKHTNQKYIKSIKIPVPSLKIQEKIVKVLDQSQALIDKRKEQIEALDQLIESIFYTMFGDPVKNEKGWKAKKLGDYIIHMNNGLQRRGRDDDGEIVLRLVELQSNYIDYSNYNRIKLEEEERKKYQVFDQDILFARVNGNPDYVGRSSVYYEKMDEKVYFNDHIIRASFDLKKINPLYITTLLNTQYGIGIFKEHIKTSAGQFTINQNGIKSLKISIPPVSLQNKFAQKVEIIEKQKQLLDQSLELLEENYKSIMDKAFKGQLFN